MGSGYRRKIKTTDQRPLLKECATTKPCEGCVRSTSREYRLPERAASSGRRETTLLSRGALLSRLRVEFLLDFTGEFDESRRQANVFIEWIALIIA